MTMEEKREIEEQNGTPPGRRKLLKWLSGTFLAFWGVVMAGSAVSFLKAPESRRGGALNSVSGGDAESLGAGEARLVRHGNDPIFVVRLAGGELVAVSALCTHFRCVLKWNAAEKSLVCPCHNGAFNATGDVIAGLPTRPLRTYPVETRRGEILVFV